MAIIKIKPIKVRVKSAIKYITDEEKVSNNNFGLTKNDLLNSITYIENDNKTQDKEFVSSINCNLDRAVEEMTETKISKGKTGGILAYHIIQSFDKEEVTPEQTHQLGIEFVEEMFEGNFEIIIATHLNTKHYHNHIIVNSVSFVDGSRFNANRETYARMRHINDNLCKSHNLKVLDNKKSKNGIDYEQYYKGYERKNNYKNKTKRIIDSAIKESFSFEDFKDVMNKYGYEVNIRYGKISVKDKNHNRNIRIERAYGEDYTVDKIKKRILEELPSKNKYSYKYRINTPKKDIFHTKYKKNKRKSKGFIALYYHYCYLLKTHPRKVRSRLSNFMKEEVERMELYSKEAKFLNINNINTLEDISLFDTLKNREKSELISKREALYRLRKKEIDPDEKERLTKEISDISKEIRFIQEQINIAERIEDRIPEIKEKLKRITEEREEEIKKSKEREQEKYKFKERW